MKPNLFPKLSTNTPLWIRSWSDLQTPITAFRLAAKDSARDRQSGGKMKKEEADTLLAQIYYYSNKLCDVPSKTVSKLFLNLQIKQSKLWIIN